MSGPAHVLPFPRVVASLVAELVVTSEVAEVVEVVVAGAVEVAVTGAVDVAGADLGAPAARKRSVAATARSEYGKGKCAGVVKRKAATPRTSAGTSKRSMWRIRRGHDGEAGPSGGQRDGLAAAFCAASRLACAGERRGAACQWNRRAPLASCHSLDGIA